MSRTSIYATPPALAHLPPPPAGKSGWPWTDESRPLPDCRPDGRPWPRISIVTPSYNQAQFLEETIRSVLLQRYPNLEYIVVDGGSTDGSERIIERYAGWLAHWESAPDRGQADALNKGFARASGEIRAYINSDDFYFPGIFRRVAELFLDSGNDGFLVLLPVEHFGDVAPYSLTPRAPDDFSGWLKKRAVWCQPGLFWSRRVHEAVGAFDSGLHYVFDEKFLLEALWRGFRPRLYSGPAAAAFRHHRASKTTTEGQKDIAESRFFRERLKIRKQFAQRISTEEWRDVVAFLRQLLMSERYREAMLADGTFSSVRAFAGVARFFPSVLSTRFYWGALRDLLLRRSKQKWAAASSRRGKKQF